uniref:DUF4939 domain-containing protein n=1 Tax=Naja naja TaxID=35670 RepID=A0A8C6YCB1_NAJNA
MPRVITFCSQPFQLASVLHAVTKDQLRAGNDQLAQQVAVLTVQVAQMQAVRPCCKCPVAVPDKFDGLLAQFPAFFGQYQVYMSLWTEDFPTDWDKMVFLISLLSGSAVRWELMHLCLHIDTQRQVQRWMEATSTPIKMVPPLVVPLDKPMQLGAADLT